MPRQTIIILFFVLLIVSTMMVLLYALIRNKQTRKKGLKIQQRKEKTVDIDSYDAFVSSSNLVGRLNSSKVVNKIGNWDKTNLEELFDNAKNPWGITPTIFKFIRYGLALMFIVVFGVLYAVFGDIKIWIFGIMLSVIAWWYPAYYYKAIGKERAQEWDKVYQFTWLIKNTCMLYDAKKVCLETTVYLQKNYPEYKEIIDGFKDFHDHWDGEKVPEYINRFYNIPIAKEIYQILLNMNITGMYPETELDSLRAYSLNMYNRRIQDTLSNVPHQATLSTLPFLMLSAVIGLLVPMIVTMMKTMR